MRRKKKEWKILQKFCNLAYSMYLCPDKESLKQAGGFESGVHWQANHGRMRKWVIGLPLATERTQEPLPVRNPDFSQSSELPLFTKGLRFYPKLQNNFDIPKKIHIFALVRFLHLITIRPQWPKGKTYAPASVGAFLYIYPCAHGVHAHGVRNSVHPKLQESRHVAGRKDRAKSEFT